MFDSADLDHAIDKDTYEREVPALRAALLAAQQEAQASKRFQVIILVGGVDGAGKGEIVNLLNEWMDPRHIHTHGMGAPTDEELARPPMWRFWRALPPKGQIGIFFGSWYTEPIVSRVKGKSTNGELVERLDEVVRFERMLTDEGALVLKFWLHLSKRDQKRRLAALQADPATRWRVSPIEWKHYRIYDKFRKVSERALRQTSTGPAPWIVVSGKDARYRAITVATAILGALRRRLDEPEPEPASRAATPTLTRAQERNLLRELDLRQAIDKASYEVELERLKGRLNLLTRDKRFRRMSVAGVFEGVDAAGKGGAIRRITAALDARYYHVHPIAAPTEEERAQPYLWRFWRNVPKDGAVALFDRSWYGRVLVERVEGLAQPRDWMRAYGEINDFEEQLVRHGTVLVKFWLQVTRDEQLRRFEERASVGFKQFKITEEDWRNRDKWEQYEHAVCDMVDRTSTELARWTLVEAEDKYFARIKVLKTLCNAIESAM